MEKLVYSYSTQRIEEHVWLCSKWTVGPLTIGKSPTNISFLVCRFLAPPGQEGSLEKVTCSFRDILLSPNNYNTNFNDQKGFGETPTASVFTVFTGKFHLFS